MLYTQVLFSQVDPKCLIPEMIGSEGLELLHLPSLYSEIVENTK